MKQFIITAALLGALSSCKGKHPQGAAFIKMLKSKGYWVFQAKDWPDNRFHVPYGEYALIIEPLIDQYHMEQFTKIDSVCDVMVWGENDKP